MDLPTPVIARAMTLQQSSLRLGHRAAVLIDSARGLRADSAAIRRWKGTPWIGGGSPDAKICPICESPILAEDIVVSTRTRPTVHLLCWPVSREASGSTAEPDTSSVPAGEPATPQNSPATS